MTISKPTDVPGLIGWYSADYEATLAADNTANIQLHDLSGAGFNGDGGVGPTLKYAGGPGGSKVLECIGVNARAKLPLTQLVSASGVGLYIIATMKNTQSVTRGLWWTGTGGGGGSANYFSYSDNNIYDGFCSSSRKVVGAFPTVGPSNTWQKYEVAVTPTLWKCWVNGAGAPTFSAAHTVDISGDGSGRWWLGQNQAGDSGNGFGVFLVLNRIPTAGEQVDLKAWVDANLNGGLPVAPGGGSGSKVDKTMAALVAKGYTTGSIQDRQAAYLRAKTGLSKTSADMQKADGRIVKDVLPASTVI
jgi:hypothetical protein